MTLGEQCKAIGLPLPETELKFHPTRKWRFDYAWPDRKIACEVEGAVWVQGRHTRGSGFVKDLEKYNTAAEMGWRVVRVTTQDVKNGRALQWIERILKSNIAA